MARNILSWLVALLVLQALSRASCKSFDFNSLSSSPIAFADKRHTAQAEKISLSLPLAGDVFEIEGHNAWLILPAHQSPLEKTPWVFFAHTLAGGNPRPVHKLLFQRFVDAGIGVAGIDIGESYGSPRGRALFSALYQELVHKRGLSERPCLLAQSRGGLQIYNWADEHPQAVACIAGIFPVCDLRKYPGVSTAAAAYEMTPKQLAAAITENNPISRLEPLAKAHVPILHLHGDSDRLVPVADHSALLAERYHQAGGEMKLIVIKGQGHSLWPGWFQNQELIDFVIEHATGRTSRLPAIQPRTAMPNLGRPQDALNFGD